MFVTGVTFCALCAAQAFATSRTLGRDVSQAVRRASSKPIELPEVNSYTSQRIVDCLTEGCPVDTIEDLQDKLLRDEARIKDHIAETDDGMTQGFNVKDFYSQALDRSHELREKLEEAKGTIVTHLAGAIPFGHSPTAGFLRRITKQVA